MRVVVKVELVKVDPTPVETNTTRWQAKCHTGDCTWASPLHHVRAGAEEIARHHRHTHRTMKGAA